MKKKTLALLLALVLVFGVVAGGTVAWLTDKTDPVVNTFNYGDIDIDLTETTGNSYKIIPGMDIAKDPKVTVKATSEACWLFVEVKEEGTFVADKVIYSIAEGWTQGDGTNIPKNVYYREVGAVTADTDFSVLTDNKITVSSTLTKEDIKNITTNPTLTFTAYACQKDGIDDAATAWAKINPTSGN